MWRLRTAFVLLSLATGTTLAEPPVVPPQGRMAPSTTRAVPADDRIEAASRATAGSLDLGPAVIRSAIAEADRDWAPSRGDAAVFGSVGSKTRSRIDRRFADAAIESCGGSGALKFDPPLIGPLVFGGLFSLPWLMHAMATGRCRMSVVSPFAEGASAAASEPPSTSRPLERAPFTDRVVRP